LVARIELRPSWLAVDEGFLSPGLLPKAMQLR
jgi:hypothetical protein